MEIGSIPASETELAFQKLRLEVIVTRRKHLGEEWQYDLLSPFWRLYVHKQPGAFIQTQETKLYLRPGHLYLVPAWLAFRTGLGQPVLQNYIHFDFGGFPSDICKSHFNKILQFPLRGILTGPCRRWEASLGTNQPSWLQFAHASALIYTAMSSALSKPGEEEACFAWMKHASKFRAALERIDQDLAHPPTNKELARLSQKSMGHFIKTFRKAMGMTPSQYGTERRLATAAQWLTRTQRTISDISDSLGFADRFHFSKTFKKRFRVPPATYRRMHHFLQ